MILPWRDVAIDGGPSISTSITNAESAELARLAKGREVLEIGSAFGYSAIVMALAGARRVDAVDPHGAHQSEDAMLDNLNAHGVGDRVLVIAETSRDARTILAPGYDLVFIDGDHTRDGVIFDIALAESLTPKVIACHDYGEDSCPGVKEALDIVFPDGPTRLIDSLFVVELDW